MRRPTPNHLARCDGQGLPQPDDADYGGASLGAADSPSEAAGDDRAGLGIPVAARSREAVQPAPGGRVAAPRLREGRDPAAGGGACGTRSAANRRQTGRKHYPVKDLTAVGGWKDTEMVLKCTQADQETIAEIILTPTHRLRSGARLCDSRRGGANLKKRTARATQSVTGLSLTPVGTAGFETAIPGTPFMCEIPPSVGDSRYFFDSSRRWLVSESRPMVLIGSKVNPRCGPSFRTPDAPRQCCLGSGREHHRNLQGSGPLSTKAFLSLPRPCRCRQGRRAAAVRETRPALPHPRILASRAAAGCVRCPAAAPPARAAARTHRAATLRPAHIRAWPSRHPGGWHR